MMTRRNFAMVLLGLAAIAAEARAHFLFVRIGPQAEGGRRAEVFFSEFAEAGDPRFIAKLAGTKLWVQTEPGVFRETPVKPGVDRLRAPLPSAETLGVVGVYDYGVRAQPKKTPFLLRYYPKAVAGRPEEVNKLKPRPEIPFEIAASFEGPAVSFTVLQDGKPMPGAKFTTVDADLSNETLVADAEGKATWRPGPGAYSVYTDRTIKSPGTRDGAAFEEIREFATLAFRWPLHSDEGDPDAISLFEKAVAARAQWNDFPGFTAEIEGSVEGRAFAGSVTVQPDGKSKLELDDKVHEKWISDQLQSLVMHRRAESGDDKPVLRFADDDEANPLGRLLAFEGGRFASSYRVRDGRISVVNRNLGRSSMTILTLANELNAEGKELPRSYIVETWDATTGALTGTQSFEDRWARVGAFDLPTTHTVTSAGDSGLIVRSFTLKAHKLLPR